MTSESRESTRAAALFPLCKWAPPDQMSPCEGDPEYEWLPADDGTHARVCPVHWTERQYWVGAGLSCD